MVIDLGEPEDPVLNPNSNVASKNELVVPIKSETLGQEDNNHLPATPPEFELSPSRIKSAKVGHTRFRYNKPKSVSTKNRTG